MKGKIRNKNFLQLIDVDLEKWDLISKEIIKETQTSALLENTEGRKITVRLLIYGVLDPKKVVNIKNTIGKEGILTNNRDIDFCLTVFEAQDFIINSLLKNCWILKGFILNESGKIPIAIVYFETLKKAAYVIQKKFQKIHIPLDPQVN